VFERIFFEKGLRGLFYLFSIRTAELKVLWQGRTRIELFNSFRIYAPFLPGF
jgi:hypothetical protein